MAASIISDFWAWWIGELTSLFPRHSAMVTRDDRVVVQVAQRSCNIELRDRNGDHFTEGVADDRVGEHIAELTNNRRCELVLREGRYLARFLSANRLPFSRAYEMALIDLSEDTPFSSSDMYIGFAATDAKTAGTEYFAIKRDRLDPILESLRRAKLTPTDIRLERAAGLTSLSAKSLVNMHPAFRHRNRVAFGFAAAAVMLLLLSFATLVHAYYRFHDASQQLASEIAQKQKSALEVRRQLDNQAKDVAALAIVDKQKAQAVPVVLIWEELTRLLPDTAWITDLSFGRDGLTFSGSSVAAASLIPILDASPLFQDATFVSPVVRMPGEKGERFAIRLKVGRE
ncbi:PilN domain-containing protein [Rhizobium sp. BK491]|uniref:PilN domain-containing protein n=1 Tax=Rhizobium sp. BK491 TaxID=2587009 RepID=UPI001610BEF9|nr:PilN domain-containing protein [Rhizobium sp. BK491]MBB3571270.1 general secretion pathway protein L [Rhizobium sp. BK491]